VNTAPRTKKTPQFDLWSLTKKHHTYCCQVACTAPQAQWPDYCTHYQYQRPPNMPHKTFIWWMLTHWTRNSKVPKVAKHCQALPPGASTPQEERLLPPTTTSGHQPNVGGRVPGVVLASMQAWRLPNNRGILVGLGGTHCWGPLTHPGKGREVPWELLLSAITDCFKN